jgi:CHAT domain-containing protein
VDEAAGRTLRKLIWQPLAKALAGCSSVVIAPDGRLCAVPFAALPGGKPGTYLIEEMAIAHVASARQLVELRSRKQPAAKGGLLALGGADYGPAAAGVRGWSDLPATRREARRLGDIYRSAFSESRPRLLQGADASRAGLLRALAGGDRPRWLHLATHGFFRPPASTKARSASLAADLPELAVTYSPQLLSGVVLAGANRDPAANTLTAEEVGSLDLRGCELVVISACETGLGAAAGGEGLLGLQRAFHIAGSASVLASLWQVPDEATQVLMERFYDNLWSKKLPRGEALRQAQLWLLRQGPRHPEVVRGVVNPKTGTGRRTLADGSGRLHPFFWAAWVLSGDWR